MEVAGQKLKRIRERLNLRYRDVEEASQKIAERHGSEEYSIALSRLADIENKGTLPSIYRLYSLCVIYRLDFVEVLDWYGVNLSDLPGEAAQLQLESTHLVGFVSPGHGEIQIPLSLDPGIDLRKTTYISRMVQRWGRMPVMLLNGLELRHHRYAYIGSEDWTMYPLIQPGSLVLLDETRRRIVETGWSNEFDRPIYLLEHRDGFVCGWCSQTAGGLIVQPHPSSLCAPQVFKANEVDIVGQVVGVAMRLDQGRRRRTDA